MPFYFYYIHKARFLAPIHKIVLEKICVSNIKYWQPITVISLTEVNFNQGKNSLKSTKFGKRQCNNCKKFLRNSSLVTSSDNRLWSKHLRCDELRFQLITHGLHGICVMSSKRNSSRCNTLTYNMLSVNVTSDEFLKNFFLVLYAIDIYGIRKRCAFVM